MAKECPIVRRRRQSGPAFNAKRRAYHDKNRAALKLVRHLGISINEARRLALATHGESHVGVSAARE
jgi:hypothetical protein